VSKVCDREAAENEAALAPKGLSSHWGEIHFCTNGWPEDDLIWSKHVAINNMTN
jgi:hypothetical protein